MVRLKEWHVIFVSSTPEMPEDDKEDVAYVDTKRIKGEGELVLPGKLLEVCAGRCTGQSDRGRNRGCGWFFFPRWD